MRVSSKCDTCSEIFMARDIIEWDYGMEFCKKCYREYRTFYINEKYDKKNRDYLNKIDEVDAEREKELADVEFIIKSHED